MGSDLKPAHFGDVAPPDHQNGYLSDLTPLATPLALGLLAVLAIKLVVLAQLGSHPLLQPRGVLDDAVYLKLAQRVAGGDLALGPDVYYLSPFYTYFLGAIFGLGGSIATARLVQVLLGAVAVVLAGLATRRLWGARAGWIAAAAAALTGVFTFNEVLLLQSSVDPFLTALALWTLARAVGQASGRKLVLPWVLAGISLGLLCLNRPNALAAAALVGIALLVARRGRTAALQAGAFAIGLCLVIAPVAARNRLVADEWVLITSHGGLNFYIGNHEGATGTWSSVPGISPSIEGQSRDAAQVASAALGRAASASDASAYFSRLAWQWIGAHPADTARLWLRKLALAFSNTDLALNYSYTYYAHDERTLLSLLAIGPWLLVPLGLLGLLIALARPPRPDARAGLVGWAVFLFGYAASLVVFFVASRYRLPLLVALCVGTGIAVDWGWSSVSARAWRNVAVLGGGVFALAAMPLLPLEADTGRFFERGERIVQLTTAGEDAAAEELLASTEAHHPQRAVLLYRVGRARQERGRQAEAVPLFERALQADPAAVDVRLSLAEAYEALGRAEDAVRAIEAAMRSPDIVPEDVLPFGARLLAARNPAGAEKIGRLASARWPSSAAAHDLLGVALMVQDRRAEGESALRQAVTLDSSSATARYHLAQALALSGRRDEAIALLQETLRLRPDYPEARQLLERIGAR